MTDDDIPELPELDSDEDEGADGGEEEEPMDSFVLEEYKNISKAHYELHNGFRQMFRFYLGVVAVPVTLFAFAYKDQNVTLSNLPSVFVYICLLIGIIGCLMFLSLINIRFDIIFYTRTVNGTRAYFVNKDNNLSKYLMLPGDMRFPPYKETFRAYWWQFLMIAIINSIYLGVALKARFSQYWPYKLTVAIFVLHFVAYYGLASMRHQGDERRLTKIGHGNTEYRRRTVGYCRTSRHVCE
jgi:hypothetical protein